MTGRVLKREWLARVVSFTAGKEKVEVRAVQGFKNIYTG